MRALTHKSWLQFVLVSVVLLAASAYSGVFAYGYDMAVLGYVAAVLGFMGLLTGLVGACLSIAALLTHLFRGRSQPMSK